MCPDKKTLSAFADGELALTEMHEVGDHLRVCGGCERKVTAFRRLGSLLRESSEVSLDVAEAKRRTDRALTEAAGRVLPFWRRRVRFSFAALVALAAFVLGGGVSLTLVANRNGVSEMAAEGAKPLDVTINVKDVRQLFEILNNQQAIREVTIQLPEAQKFEFRGEPVFLRAAEYSKGVFR